MRRLSYRLFFCFSRYYSAFAAHAMRLRAKRRSGEHIRLAGSICKLIAEHGEPAP
jgi:hypothetical protein